MAKGDTFSLNPYINNYFEEKEMQKIPDVSAVGSRIYAQVCIRSDIAYVTGMLGRYLSNPVINHWKATKRVFQ